MSGKQLRIHFTGALELSKMQVITHEYETVDADSMIDFLKKLEKNSKATKIHLILDNARSNKNKKLTEFLKTSRIIIHYLPPYSPNLNPIERLWKMLREKVLYNRYYLTAPECFKAIRKFFYKTIPKEIGLLKKRINDNFQIIQLNPVSII